MIEIDNDHPPARPRMFHGRSEIDLIVAITAGFNQRMRKVPRKQNRNSHCVANVSRTRIECQERGAFAEECRER